MGAIRLFLAIAVFQSHIVSRILAPNGLHISNALVLGMNGGFAVMFFFIISGFLISFVLEEKYDRPGGTAAFYRARALRIYPLWWSLYLIVPIITYGGLWSFIRHHHIYDLMAGFFLYGSDWLLSFWTYPLAYTAPMPHGLELGWTLATEMSFYLLAPFILRSKALPVAILLASILLRIILNISITSDQGAVWAAWCYYFFPSTIMFFMLGHLTRQLHKSLKLPRWSAWAAIALAAIMLLIQDQKFNFDNVYFYLAIALFAVSLPVIFNATKDNRVCNFLGDLTYPLYITSGVLLILLRTPSSFFYGIDNQIQTTAVYLFDASPLAKAAFISIALWGLMALCAVAVHFLIEKPAIACLRAVLILFDRRARIATVPILADGAVPRLPQD